MQFRPLPVLLVAASCFAMSVGAQSADPPIPFLGFRIDDDTTAADRSLASYLARELKRPFEYNDRFETYGDLVEDLTRRRGAYVARMTPYSFIAARMLGAEFDVLATYVSKTTRKTTYNSYIVVNAEKFGSHDRTLDGVKRFLESRRGGEAARFIFHDEFSTSSYFVPALWLRNNHVFATERSNDPVVRIEAQRAAKSSTELATMIAAGQADFAAVWDGTMAKFRGGDAELTRLAQKLLFIPLPNLLPNDLLVSSNAVDDGTEQRIVTAIGAMKAGAIAKGDFDTWMPIHDAPDALAALAALNRDATAPAAPVVVRVQEANAASKPYVDEVRQAVRLSGTEFVLELPKFHENHDVLWTVEKVHDGAIKLSTAMVESALQGIRQEFQLSFTPATGDLTKRVVSLMHSRMHRIRYIWPYKAGQPTVIRDVDFILRDETDVKVQRITWRDPDRNDFVPGRAFDAKVVSGDDYKFTFGIDAFRADTGATDFQNPLSNVAYRVILRRDPIETALSKVLTVSFVSLLLLAALGAAIDLRRRTRPVALPVKQTLRDVCAARAAAQHDAWLGRTLKESDLLWCERERVETLIADFKQRRLVPAAVGGITSRKYGFGAGLSIPLLRGISGHANFAKEVQLVVDPERVSDPVRLDALLDLLIRKRMLSSFVGRPLEWEALNELARGVLDLPSAAAARLVDAQNPNVVDIASRHFNHAIDDAMKQVCFFSGTWTTTHEQGRQLARQRVTLPGPLWFGKERVHVASLVLEFNVPEDVALSVNSGSKVDCWIVGRIVRASLVSKGEELCLHFRTIAVILSEFVTPAQDSEPMRRPVSDDLPRPAVVGV
jgi:ABC-type phosphate/phosphonate transport system substrate-binding protein